MCEQKSVPIPRILADKKNHESCKINNS